MAIEAPDLPIRWSLPRPPASWWFAWMMPVLCVSALALAAVHRDWFSAILPCCLFLTWWERVKGGRSESCEITYAAARGPWSMVGNRSIEWGRVRRVEISGDAIRLYRSKHWSPVLLKLPEDPEQSERIVAAVHWKAKSAELFVRTSSTSGDAREQAATPRS